MTKQSLSDAHRTLIEQCQQINFGRIIFHVKGGQPDGNKPVQVVKSIKLSGGENGPRPESTLADFTLRKEHTALIAELAQVGDGSAVTLEVKHGVPFGLQVETAA